ncbi:DUF7546 family protein [Haloprofundus salilacus]|uniref:DUF7546 family protein n=1 Tax=Haloprofundus salilacus TaxID=2876190 RepID=UPI001CCA9184|nr:hypothetical protein [Haloprofundus salilacus]
MSTLARSLPRPSHDTLLYVGVLFNVELAALLAYGLLTPGTLLPARYTVYGLLWLNAGVLAVAKTTVAPSSMRTKRRAAAVAVGYFAALAVAGGLVTLASPHGGAGFRIGWLPPGWGPALIYGGETLNVILMPGRVVGYAALAYLVYATVIDAAGAAVSGLLGLLSCVSCSWPILASLATAVLGSGSALAASATALSYDLSTVVFLATVALLYWRPFGR